jgi:predicted glycosyltransferase
MVGGGCDGRQLAEAFARADLPIGHDGVLLTGPHMAARDVAALEALVAGRPDLRLHRFLPDPVRWVRGAAAVVTMGGYNAVCEVLASGRPALVVPRVTPRLEQAVRADRLAQRTGLATLRPDAATPPAIGEWLRDAVGSGPHRHRIDLDGLARVPRLVEALVDPVHTELEVAHAGA